MVGERREPQGEVDPQDIRDYIHEMLGQLAELASAHGEPELAVTLRTVASEARDSSAH